MKPRYGREAVLLTTILVAILAIIYGPRMMEGRHPFLEIIDDPGGLLNSYPWGMYAAKMLHNGHFPLWNPYSGAGIPLLANYQSAVLFPLHLIFYLVPNAWAFDLLLSLRLLLMGITFWWFLRSDGLSQPASIAGAVAFAFCGYFMRMAYMVHLNVEMLLPVSLIVIRGLVKDPCFKYVIACSAITGLALLGGNPQSAMMLVIFMGFFMLSRTKNTGNLARGLLMLSISVMLGGVLSFAQTLPFAEAVSQSWHVHELGHGSMHAPPMSFFSLFAPWALGPIRQLPISTAFMPYVGASVFALALTAVINIKYLPRRAWGYALFAILFLCVGYGFKPLSLIQSLPVLKRVVLTKYAQPAAVLCMVALAAHAIDLLASRKIRFTFPALISLVIIFGTSMLPILAGFNVQVMPVLFATGIVATLLVVWLAASNSRRQIFAWTAASLVIVGAIHDERGLVSLNRGINFSPNENFVEIQKSKPQARILNTTSLMRPNLNLLLPITEFQIFEALYPQRYVELMSGLLGFDMKDAVKHFDQNNAYFPLKSYVEDIELYVDLFASLGITDIFSFGYFNEDALNIKQTVIDNVGLVQIPHHINFINNPKDALKVLSRTPYKMLDRAYIESDQTDSKVQEVPDVKEMIGFSDNPEKRLYRVEKRESSLHMVVRETYYPGWRAFVDGSETRIWRANWLFMAVELPMKTDASLVELRYVPWSFKIGLFASITNAVFMLLFLCKIKTRKSGGR